MQHASRRRHGAWVSPHRHRVLASVFSYAVADGGLNANDAKVSGSAIGRRELLRAATTSIIQKRTSELGC